MKPLLYRALYTISAVCVLSCAQAQMKPSGAATPPAAVGRGVRAFPFVVDSADAQYDLSINLSDPSLQSQFGPLFRQYDLAFDVDSWEALVMVLIEKADASLAPLVTDFWDDPVLYFQSGSAAGRQTILNVVRPVFYDKKQLEELMPRVLERLDQ